MTSYSPDPGPAARHVGEAGGVLCRLLDPRGPGAAVVWARAPRRDTLLARWRDDPRAARALPVVATLLREADLLGALAPGERALAEASRAWGETRAGAMASLASALARAAAASGARVLLCKAAALHGLLYPDPASRPAADVDAFVPREDLAALHAALPSHGFRPVRGAEERISALRAAGDPSLADVEYVGPEDVHLEVKADPIAMGMPLARTDELAGRSRPSPRYEGLRIPAPEVLVLQQAFSIARRPSPDLLAHAELAGVLARDGSSLDLPWIRSLLDGEGLDGVLRAVLEAVERLFPGAVPRRLLSRCGRPAGAVPRRLRAAPRGAPLARGGAVRMWTSRGLSTRRRVEFARWVLRRAFPPAPLLAVLADDPSTSRALRALRRLCLRVRPA